MSHQVRHTRNHIHGPLDARARRVPDSGEAKRATPAGRVIACEYNHHRTICHIRELVLLKPQSLQELQL